MSKPLIIAIAVLLAVVIGYFSLRYSGRQPAQPDRAPESRRSSLVLPQDIAPLGRMRAG